jgi:hypothetical protein
MESLKDISLPRIKMVERINELANDTSNRLKERVLSSSTFSIAVDGLTVPHNWQASHVLATGSLKV